MGWVIHLLVLQWCNVVVPHWLWNLAWGVFGLQFFFVVVKAIKSAKDA